MRPRLLVALVFLAVSPGLVGADGEPRRPVPALEISLSSVFVEDQAAALEFYTDVLGFTKKVDIPLGEYRWLTVVSPGDPEGTQLLLEPNANPAAKEYQAAIRKQGIPAAAFAVDDIEITHRLLVERGVSFTMKPTSMGTTTMAIFDDTCGNLIQIYEVK